MALQTKNISTGDYAWKSWSNGYVISLTLTEESVNTTANTSLVSYLFTISNTNNNRFYDNNNSWTISIGEHTIAINGFNFDLSANYTTQTIASGQVTVAHDADGKKDMPYSVSVPNIQSWNKYGPPAMSLSGTWSLSPIITTPPAITQVSIIDSNDQTYLLTNDRNCLVRYCSNAAVSVSAEAYGDGQIEKLTATCDDGKILSSATGQLEGTMQGVGSGNFTIRVTDSAGKTAVQYKTLPLIEYVKLTCNLENNKPDAEGNMTVGVSGNYFNGSFGAVGNALSVQFRYKRKGTSWQDTEEERQNMEPALTGNSYTAQAELSGLDYQKAYTFQARAIDKLTTVNAKQYTAVAMPVFDWGEQDFAIHGDLHVDGGVSVDGDVSVGGGISVDGSVSVDGVPVLTTPHVQTYYWQTEGGVCLDSVVDFLATCTRDCGFMVVIRGTGYPFVGMAVGAVYGNGKYGAITLYDCDRGVQSRRVANGALYEY